MPRAKFAPIFVAGWPCLPLARDGRKTPLVKGYHGADRKHADLETVKAWSRDFPDANPGIVMAEGVIGLDVDGPSHGKDIDGRKAIAAFEEKYGPLPEAGHIYHGTDEEGNPSPFGTRLYRWPTSMLDVYTPGNVVGNLTNVTGIEGVDIIAPWIRYNLAPGAVHADGSTYEFYPSPTPGLAWLPKPSDLPELTPKQAKALLKRARKAPSKPLAPAVPVEKPLAGPELLAVVRRLSGLDFNERLTYRGKQVGWQENNGFYLLACDVLRVAKDREKAKRAFLRAASAAVDSGYDVEREWENALAAVEAEEPEDLDGAVVYAKSVSQETYQFTAEFLAREFTTDEGVLRLRFRHDDRTFWMWDERARRYVHLSEDEVEAIVSKRLIGAYETFMSAEGPERRPIKITPKVWVSVVACLRLLALTSEHGGGSLLPSVGGVPFRNGWLDVESGRLVPIGPERDIRWNVPADYVPDAECPEWIQFLKSLGWDSDTEEYRLLRQWMGYVLSGRKDQERGMLMHGPTRSGKGTIIHVAHALLGEGAVGTTLDSLTRNFGLQNFIGKGLATIGDARFGRSDKALNGVLLSLTSNDPLPVDVKYGKPLSINLPVRLMIATNETPNFIEASDALGMRFVVLKFEESFLGREDRELGNRLMGELPGIARWALEGLHDLNDEGKFTETVKGRALQRQMVQESAFVRIFVDENCVLDMNMRESNEKLYNEYSLWAEQNNMPVYNSVRFGRELLDAFPGRITSGSFKVGKKVVRGKFGIKVA